MVGLVGLNKKEKNEISRLRLEKPNSIGNISMITSSVINDSDLTYLSNGLINTW